VLDMTTLLRLETAGDCDIIGVCVTSANTKAAPALLGHLNYYGRADIPVGANTSDLGNSGSAYTESNATNFGVEGYADASDFPAGVDVYRQQLAAAADNSVTIVTSGGLSSLAALLQSSADGYSALTGAELFAAKVRAVYMVAGYWDGTGTPVSDMNTTRVAADYVLQHNGDVPIYLVGIELGDTVYTGGGGTITDLPSENPMRAAWVLYHGDELSTTTRQAWAQLGILAAVYGHDDNFYFGGTNGTASVNTSTGVTAWASAPDSKHFYLRKAKADASLVTELNAILGVNPV